MSNQTDDRFNRLLAFADDVLTVYDALGIDPLLDGSMAVKAFTQDPAITVRDIDLNCLEDEITRRNDLFTGELMTMARRVGMLEAQLE